MRRGNDVPFLVDEAVKHEMALGIRSNDEFRTAMIFSGDQRFWADLAVGVDAEVLHLEEVALRKSHKASDL